MATEKKPSALMGRPKGNRKGKGILEERVILPILDKRKLTFKDYWELYMAHPDLESRAKIQRLPTEDGSLELVPRDKVETTDSFVSQIGFREWFTKRGLKLHRLANLLSLLKLKVVIVPYHSKVTVVCDGSKVECPDVGETDISIFTFDEAGTRPVLSYVAVPLPEEKVVLRKARPSPKKTEDNVIRLDDKR